MEVGKEELRLAAEPPVTKRNFPDWIPAYLKYAAVTEAPRRMHFWSAIGTIAGALRRKVWLDMRRFMWYPSFYIIHVGPPGVVTKSTTIDIGMDLLREVPGIKFGPNAITWQALVTAFAAANESFELDGLFYPMSPLTLVASEFGSLVNLQDPDMINLLIELWDGKKSYEKITKMSGNDTIDAPWINILAGTTPNWIAANMPQSMIGGGLSSRCIFIYGDKKERFIAYLDEVVEEEDAACREKLVRDLEQISLMTGPFRISESARAWGRAWYEDFAKDAAARANDPLMEGYGARKQTHLHKVAMILSASRSGDRIISEEDIILANTMLLDIEKDMHRVFSNIGKTDDGMSAATLIAFIRAKSPVAYETAYKAVHGQFPYFRDFESIIEGAVRSGQIKLLRDNTDATKLILTYVGDSDAKAA